MSMITVMDYTVIFQDSLIQQLLEEEPQEFSLEECRTAQWHQALSRHERKEEKTLYLIP